MLSLRASATALLLLLTCTCSAAQDKDYLQKGERKPFDREDAKYDKAIRDVLRRGWRKDVVVRIVDLPAFSPESVTGVCRSSAGYRAFVVTASPQIWEEIGFGSTDPHKRRGDYSRVRPILSERPISDSTASRAAALWRHVLGDQRNYGKDPNMYLDTDQLIFYLGFLPNERVTANTVGWGWKIKELLLVTDVLASYAQGKSSPAKLNEALSKSERRFRI